MVFGGVDEERIVLNESSVWSGSREDADRPDAHQALPEIRRLLLEGKNVEAEQLVNANFTCQGAAPATAAARTCRSAATRRWAICGCGSARARAGRRSSAPAGIAPGRPNQEIEFSTDGNADTKWCIIHEGRPVVVAARCRHGWRDGPRLSLHFGRGRAGARSANVETRRLARTARPGRCSTSTRTSRCSRSGTRSRVLQDRQASRVPVLPFHVRAESRRHAFPSGGDRARRRDRERRRRLREDYSRTLDLAHGGGEGRVQEGRRALHARAFRQRARRGVRLASDRRQPGRCPSPSRSTGPSGSRPRRWPTDELLMTGTLNDGRGGKGVTLRRAAARAGARRHGEGGGQHARGRAAPTKWCCCLPPPRTIAAFAGRQLTIRSAATQRDLDQAAKKSSPSLRAAQQADHEKWFNRVELNLPATANSALPTDRAAGRVRQGRGGSGAGGAVFQLRPLPADQLVAARRPAGQSAGHLGRGNPDAVERRLAPRHQRPDELLAGRGLQPLRAARAAAQAHRLAGRAGPQDGARPTTTRAAGWRT